MKHLNGTIWICVNTTHINNLEFFESTLYYLKKCNLHSILIEHHSGRCTEIEPLILLKKFKPY